ncbi:histidine phosphatase family protein [Shimazuella kribbensis]|uniref:histidine phosphatase family protein n=1 Tax=Shimazuella kribbensis TaxID=139808 RepID=UPI00048BA21B|nr:histidine phosphatase family protein [Shimazuella kribbensis]
MLKLVTLRKRLLLRKITQQYFFHRNNSNYNILGINPVDDAGLEQAQQLAKRLQNISFDSIYSSSSNRAFSTALHLRKDREMEVIRSSHGNGFCKLGR